MSILNSRTPGQNPIKFYSGSIHPKFHDYQGSGTALGSGYKEK